MEFEVTKMSSKGQIVIPQDIRKQVNAEEGTLFVVMNDKDTIILKKMQKPSKEVIIKQIEKMAKEGRKVLEARGLTEKDVIKIALKSRGK